MKKVIGLILLAAMLCTMVFGLTSCGMEDDGAQISVYLADRVYGFDPAGDYTDDAVISVMYLLYEPLFLMDEDGDVHKGMAKDYEVDKETGDLLITLRESYWSNGNRVTADDFVYAWTRLISPDFASPAASLLYDVKNALKIKTASGDDANKENDLYYFGATAPSPDMLRIAFESPDVDVDAFIRNLCSIALAPVNRNSVIGQEHVWSNGTANTCYTNGPFQVQTLNNVDGYFILARNDGYRRPEDSNKDPDHYVVPALLRTIWNVDEEITDAAHLEALYDGMAANTIFYMNNLSLSDRKTLGEKDAVVSDNLSTYTYAFNTENPLFSSAAVRNILSKVIDRNYIVNELTTFGRPADGLIAPAVWNSDSAREKKSFRSMGSGLIETGAVLTIDAAKTELANAGATFGEFTITHANTEEDKAIADYVAGLWNQLGYTVTTQAVDYSIIQADPETDNDGKVTWTEFKTSTLQYLYESGDFDVIAIDYQMYGVSALAPLAALSSDLNGNGVDMNGYNLDTSEDKTVAEYVYGNVVGYHNDEYDALIAQAASTYDLDARADLLHQAESILMADMPVMPLMYNQSFYVVNNKMLRKLDMNYAGFTVFTEATLKDYEEYFLMEE